MQSQNLSIIDTESHEVQSYSVHGIPMSINAMYVIRLLIRSHLIII